MSSGGGGFVGVNSDARIMLWNQVYGALVVLTAGLMFHFGWAVSALTILATHLFIWFGLPRLIPWLCKLANVDVSAQSTNIFLMFGFSASNIYIQIPKGPIAHIYVRHVQISWVALSIIGVKLVLRETDDLINEAKAKHQLKKMSDGTKQKGKGNKKVPKMVLVGLAGVAWLVNKGMVRMLLWFKRCAENITIVHPELDIEVSIQSLELTGWEDSSNAHIRGGGIKLVLKEIMLSQFQSQESSQHVLFTITQLSVSGCITVGTQNPIPKLQSLMVNINQPTINLSPLILMLMQKFQVISKKWKQANIEVKEENQDSLPVSSSALLNQQTKEAQDEAQKQQQQKVTEKLLNVIKFLPNTVKIQVHQVHVETYGFISKADLREAQVWLDLQLVTLNVKIDENPENPTQASTPRRRFPLGMEQWQRFGTFQQTHNQNSAPNDIINGEISLQDLRAGVAVLGFPSVTDFRSNLIKGSLKFRTQTGDSANTPNELSANLSYFKILAKLDDLLMDRVEVNVDSLLSLVQLIALIKKDYQQSVSKENGNEQDGEEEEEESDGLWQIPQQGPKKLQNRILDLEFSNEILKGMDFVLTSQQGNAQAFVTVTALQSELLKEAGCKLRGKVGAGQIRFGSVKGFELTQVGLIQEPVFKWESTVASVLVENAILCTEYKSLSEVVALVVVVIKGVKSLKTKNPSSAVKQKKVKSGGLQSLEVNVKQVDLTYSGSYQVSKQFSSVGEISEVQCQQSLCTGNVCVKVQLVGNKCVDLSTCDILSKMRQVSMYPQHSWENTTVEKQTIQISKLWISIIPPNMLQNLPQKIGIQAEGGLLSLDADQVMFYLKDIQGWLQLLQKFKQIEFFPLFPAPQSPTSEPTSPTSEPSKPKPLINLTLLNFQINAQVGPRDIIGIKLQKAVTSDPENFWGVRELFLVLNQADVLSCGEVELRVMKKKSGNEGIQVVQDSDQRDKFETEMRPFSKTDIQTAYTSSRLGQWCQGEGPQITIDILARKAVYNVPYHESPGRMTQYSQLWGKALKQVLQEQLELVKDIISKISKKAAVKPHMNLDQQKKSKTVQIQVRAADLGMRFVQHEFEAELALILNQVLETTTQQRAWDAAIDSHKRDLHAVDKESKNESKSHSRQSSKHNRILSFGSGVGSKSADSWTPVGGDQPLLAADELRSQESDEEIPLSERPVPVQDLLRMKLENDLARIHGQKIKALRSEREKDPLTRLGCALSVKVDSVRAILVIRDLLESSDRSEAYSHIDRLDPPSAKVEMEKMQMIHVWAEIHGALAHLGGYDTPMAEAAQVNASGAIVMARQLCSPPMGRQITVPVGRWHRVHMQVSKKGCKPPLKAYTDLDAEINRLNFNFSIGMEPTFALMAQASKRFVPPPNVEGDGELPLPDGSPVLQWWDRMRYMWRGKAGVTIKRLDAVLAGNVLPEVSEYEERLQLMVAEFKGQLAEEIVVELYGMRGKGFRKQDNCISVPGFLEEFNYGDLNHVEMRFDIQWQMQGGRGAHEHHIFPIHARGDPAVPSQEPQIKIEVFDQFRGSAWTFGITGHVHPPDDKQGEMPWAVLGEHQVRFIKEVIGKLTQPGIPVRGASRRGDFFFRKPPSSSIKGRTLNSMMKKVTVDIIVPMLDVFHMSVKVGDASDGIRVAVNGVRLSMQFDYFRVANNYITSGGFRREKTRMRQHMSHLRLDVFEVKGYRKVGEDVPVPMSWGLPQNSDPLKELLGHSDQEISKGPSSGPTSSHQALIAEVRQGEAFLLYVGSLVLRQTSKYRQASSSVAYSLDGEELPPERQEPLKIIAEDLKALMPVEARNAVYAIAIHMANAFVPRKKESPKTHQKPMLSQDLQNELPLEEQISAEVESELGGDDLYSIIMRENSQLSKSRTSMRREATSMSEAASSVLTEQSLHGTSSLLPPHETSEQNVVEEQPILTHEIEFARIQVNIEAPESNGFFLVSVDRGHLVVKLHAERQEKVLNFNMDHVQGFITNSEVDPENSIHWLVIQDGRLLKPQDNTYSVQVLKPFSMKLKQLRSIGGSDLGSKNAQQVDHGGENQLLLSTVNLLADMNSREFDILLDVISNNLMLQMPKIDILATHIKTLEADRYDEVISAKEAVRVARAVLSRVRAQAHLLALLSGEKLGYESHTPLHEQILTAPSLRREEFYPSADGLLTQEQEELSFADFLPMLGIKLREAHREGSGFYFALDEVTGDSLLDGNLGGIDGCPLLVRWLDGEEVKIMEVLDKVVDMHEKEQVKFQSLVERHKKIAAQAWSSQLVASVENIRWNLRDDSGAYFMQAFIQNVAYDTLRNKDNSGQTSLIVQDIRVVHVGNEEEILAQWNPSESYKREDFLRGLAVLDKPTEDEVIYSMLEVKVHPLKVHLTESLAKQVLEYFFPKTQESSKGREEFEKSLKINKGRRTQATASEDVAAEETQPSPNKSRGTRVEFSTSPSKTQVVAHSRGLSIDSAFDQVADDLVGTSGARDTTHSKNFTRQSSHGRRATVADTTSSPATDSRSARATDSAPSKKPKYVRKIRFVNANLNRCHILLTFQATAFSLTNKKIVLDECVYTQLVGRWKDLLSKLKGNVINSALKSVVGLQNRKFDKLLREGDLEAITGTTASQSSQKGGLGIFRRKKKAEGESLLENDDVIPEEEQKEEDDSQDNKKRMQLLGTFGRK